MTVEAIKKAIAGLPENERHSLAAWLMELEFDAWDKQMVKDSSCGGRARSWLNASSVILPQARLVLSTKAVLTPGPSGLNRSFASNLRTQNAP